MLNVLINKLTGAMFVFKEGTNLGTLGNQLLTNPNCVVIKDITQELTEHIKKKHCVWAENEIVLLPESEWFENRIEEEEIV
jgi:hypothetical protein